MGNFLILSNEKPNINVLTISFFIHVNFFSSTTAKHPSPFITTLLPLSVKVDDVGG